MTDFRALILGLAFAAAVCAAAMTGFAYAQTAEVSPRSRAEAIIAALSTGDPTRFEEAVRSHYSPELLARRTPEQRAQLVRQLADDFGAMQIERLMLGGEGMRTSVRGATGEEGTFIFGFGPAPENRIISVQVEIGGDDDGPAPANAPVNASMSAAEMSAALDGWLAPMAQRDEFAGVVLIARNGEPFVTRAYGPARRNPNVAANDRTVYNIASIGKKITQAAVARLIQEGRLSRDDTVGAHIPDYPQVETRAATIDQLITMRGGVSDFFGPEFDAADKSQFTSNRDYYRYVSNRPADFAPGARVEYCNGCYIVLAEIVERVSGMRFEDYVQRVVFAPAGMSTAGYFRSNALPDNTARGYTRRNAGGALAENTNDHGLAGSGAGGVYASARDLLAFDNALREGRLLNPAMTAWVTGGDAIENGRNAASLGVAGGAPGTNALLDSDGRWTVIVTANTDPPSAVRTGTAIASALRR